jgi:DNA-binding GntR family transcriptional regulator
MIGSNESVIAEVEGRLVDLLMRGELTPGQPLRQVELASRLGVSRTPIREAIARLEGKGLAVTQPRGGAVVYQPELGDVREIYELRSMLEGRAAEIAATRADADQLGRLSALCKQMEERAGQTYHRANSEFHLSVYRLANKPHLFGLIVLLRNRSDPYVARIFPLGRSEWKAGNESHRRLVEALRSNDAPRAGAIVREHLDNTIKLIVETRSA